MLEEYKFLCIKLNINYDKKFDVGLDIGYHYDILENEVKRLTFLIKLNNL
jgi:hypothetical protein